MASGTNSKVKWMQKAVPKKNVGKLHEMLNVPQGQPIPVEKLQEAVKKGGLIAKRAQFALNVRKLGK